MRPRQIPVEAHEDTTELVAVDLSLADHLGGLRTLDHRHRRPLGRGHRRGIGHQRIAAGKAVAVALSPRSVGLADKMMAGRQAQIGLARARHPVARQRHPLARAEAHAVPHRPVAAVAPALLLRPQARHQPAHILRQIVARIVEALDLALRVLRIAQTIDLHRLHGRLEVVVRQPHRAGGEVALGRPVPEMFLVVLVMAVIAFERARADISSCASTSSVRTSVWLPMAGRK